MSTDCTLLADIGGTYTRLALLDDVGQITNVAVRENADFLGMEALLGSYIATLPVSQQPGRAALAVACPVTGDRVTLTNFNLSFSVEATRAGLGLNSIRVINDFTAVALAIPHLDAQDVLQLGGGTPVPDAAIGVLGPGTGLGVSGLVPHAGGWIPITGEGGHVTVGATTDEEEQVLAWFRQRHGHASGERILSGSGLVDLYCYFSGQEATEHSPQRIAELAYNENDTTARRVFDEFFALLGNVAGNLALTLGARGGVYVAGGILPRMPNALRTSSFRERFTAKGRFRGYLEAIPTYLIVDTNVAFKGLAASLRDKHAQRDIGDSS
ncbi:MAG TPA: glucokinase [Methylomirabilota bacterium]|nr:glucokinase [Methylomirabilota bacterium]